METFTRILLICVVFVLFGLGVALGGYAIFALGKYVYSHGIPFLIGFGLGFFLVDVIYKLREEDDMEAEIARRIRKGYYRE